MDRTSLRPESLGFIRGERVKYINRFTRAVLTIGNKLVERDSRIDQKDDLTLYEKMSGWSGNILSNRFFWLIIELSNPNNLP